jgi:hypothetical protein
MLNSTLSNQKDKLMKKPILLILIAALISLTTACSLFHMSQQECMSTNWEQVGFADGAAGNPPRSLVNAVSDCAQYGITVNQKIYHKGWTSGIKQFCTFERGFTIGSQGGQLPTICPENLQGRFTAGWNKGSTNFCSNPINAFQIGKSGQPFPLACSQTASPEFMAEYEHGQHFFYRNQHMRGKIDELTGMIEQKVSQYNFRHDYDDFYRLGPDRSPSAHEALDMVNHMVSERKDLQRRIENTDAEG